MIQSSIYKNILLLVIALSPAWLSAQSSSLTTKSKKAAPKPAIAAKKINPVKKVAKKAPAPIVEPKRAAAPQISNYSQKLLSESLSMVRSGQCEQAIPKLYTLSRRNDLADEKFQIKYILGSCLLDLNLNQIAAFQFVDVIRNGNTKYTRQSIEKLTVAADELGDDSLLQYAISKVQIEDFPDRYKDMIYYRLGEIKQKNSQPLDAIQAFSKVGTSSRYYTQAKFNLGRAYLESNNPNDALKAFQSILDSRGAAPVTDTNKVAAQLAIARTYYQAQNWDAANEWYRKIPRDTDFWHDSLFEQSWSFLRAARFRSALSNFQSLHSAYYEEFYIPESLLLRSIVYLYICKYSEMEKVLDLFEKTYGPVRNSITDFLRNQKDPQRYYQEVEISYLTRKGQKPSASLKIPVGVGRALTDKGDIKRAFTYLRTLSDEKKKIESHGVFSRGGFFNYASKILNNRQKNTRVRIGEMTRAYMSAMRTELVDHYEQAGFIRYEMINGQKEQIKKRMAGKDISNEQIDEDINREFYVQNGYEYWPYDGEAWLDEVGNYHYLGKQNCE